tara:strand:+ start:49 stop:219 length:171 start_codon:yes stop_codon:yes gene_type:complete
MAIYADCKSKREARLKWRKSPKGRAWDYAYYKRPEVKARRHEQYIERKIRENEVQV